MELKKNPRKDYRKNYGLFFNIGLVLSLLFVISAFEWKVEMSLSKVDAGIRDSFEEILDVPLTEHKTEPPKPMVVPRIIEVQEEPEIEVEEFDYTFDQDEIAKIEEVIYEEPLPDEEADEIKDIVETMPSYDGGLAEFYKFVSKNLTYPSQARRMGVEGKVYVHFVIDRDGSLSNINIAKGIGYGCDEEVLRIINMSPNWNPGKQRGRPVRVRMMLPITFRLQ